MPEPGKAIKQLRRSQKVTIQELANQVGVSKSLISQVERGEVLPSLTTLDRIAKAMDVPINVFFEVESNNMSEKDIIVRKENRKKVQIAHSPVVYNLLTPTFNNSLEFLIIEVPPHVYKEHMNTTFEHSGEEYFVVLEGQLNLFIGNQEYVLNEGDSGCFDSGIKHAFENKTDKKSVFLIAATAKFI